MRRDQIKWHYTQCVKQIILAGGWFDSDGSFSLININISSKNSNFSCFSCALMQPNWLRIDAKCYCWHHLVLRTIAILTISTASHNRDFTYLAEHVLQIWTSGWCQFWKMYSHNGLNKCAYTLWFQGMHQYCQNSWMCLTCWESIAIDVKGLIRCSIFIYQLHFRIKNLLYLVNEPMQNLPVTRYIK